LLQQQFLGPKRQGLLSVQKSLLQQVVLLREQLPAQLLQRQQVMQAVICQRLPRK
jgi:hypothetical protein